MNGLPDEWMIGFEFNEASKMHEDMKSPDKPFCKFPIYLYFAFVFNTHPANHPIIQSSMGRQ